MSALSIRIINNINIFTLIIVLLTIYLNADIGFSYDYQYYNLYISQILLSSYEDLKYLQDGIYIRLSSSAGIEFGFVYIIKLISSVLSDEIQIYAVIATASLMLKVYVYRAYGVSWPWVYLMVVYSGVLLESNALRSGLSLSLFMCAMLLLDNKRNFYAVVLFIMSAIVHVQAIFFILLFFTYYIFYMNSLFKKSSGTILIFILSMFAGVFVNLVVDHFITGKFSAYKANASSSSGLSITSFFVMLSFSYYLYRMMLLRSIQYEGNEINKSRILMLVPVVSIYVLVTSISALGDRLWQWGMVLLVLFVFNYLKSRKDIVLIISGVKFSIGKILLAINILLVITGIVFRYPLSNFFSPLLPYIDFSLLGFGQ